ncbi:hypothetical protein R5N98_04280 [Tenacibaculum maritimum]
MSKSVYYYKPKLQDDTPILYKLFRGGLKVCTEKKKQKTKDPS